MKHRIIVGLISIVLLVTLASSVMATPPEPKGENWKYTLHHFEGKVKIGPDPKATWWFANPGWEYPPTSFKSDIWIKCWEHNGTFLIATDDEGNYEEDIWMPPWAGECQAIAVTQEEGWYSRIYKIDLTQETEHSQDMVLHYGGVFVNPFRPGEIWSADKPDCNPCDGYTITQQEATHVGNEPGWDHVRWEYLIEVEEGSKDVSHTSVTVGQCYEIIDCGPKPEGWEEGDDLPCEVGLDPTTGIDGVKWDVEIEAGSSQVLWFVTRIEDGKTEHGDVDASIKAGQDICDYQVDGPVCSPNGVSLISLDAKVTPMTVWNIFIIVVSILALIGAWRIVRREET